jgi:hypothetical protein
VGLTLSGLLLISVRLAANSQADLQSRIERLQHEIVEARRVVPHTSCGAPQALSALQTPSPNGDNHLVGSNGRDTAESPEERLAKHAPSGFDACARMESADALVVSTLGE